MCLVILLHQHTKQLDITLLVEIHRKPLLKGKEEERTGRRREVEGRDWGKRK